MQKYRSPGSQIKIDRFNSKLNLGLGENAPLVLFNWPVLEKCQLDVL